MTAAATFEATLDRARDAWDLKNGSEVDRLCREILAANPDHAPALHLLAEVRLSVAPDSPIANLLMAHALRRLGRASEAIPHARLATSAAPENAEAHMMLAMALRESGDIDRAIIAFQDATKADISLPQPRLNLGIALTEAGRTDEAVTVLRQLAERQPGLGEAWLQLGNAYRERGDPDLAVESYIAAIAVAPGNARAHSNLGVAYQQCGALDAAAASFETAIALDPDLAEAHKNLAMLRLLHGDFVRGFEGFTWRWRQKGPVNRPRPFEQAAWDGGPLTGQAILVWGEQGIGDEIMFASVLPEVAAQAEHTLLECEARLAPLLSRSFPNVEVIARINPPHQRLNAANIDVQCASGDLCRWLRTDRAAFSAPRAYLQADPDLSQARRRAYQALGSGPKIGIAWRSRTPLWGAIKSAPLDQWAPILRAPDVVWMNLQYGDCDEEIKRVNNDLSVKIHQDVEVNQFANLDQFAAQVAALDLVITTSNTAAHMAGALGVPTLLLLPEIPDWRWQIKGDAALWYPDMTLFRQQTRGDWSMPIEAAATELVLRINGLSTNR